MPELVPEGVLPSCLRILSKSAFKVSDMLSASRQDV